MMNNYSLDIKGLVAGGSQDDPVLKGIDLHVVPGTIHVLMGGNGTGKSTLCRALVGEKDVPVYAGNITWGEHRLLEMKSDEIARLGILMAFQSPVSLPGVSLATFMQTLLRMQHGKAYNPAKTLLRMREALKALNLTDDFLKKDVNDQLSGGEKKKAEIFQMMLLKPSLLLLDEVDSGVDLDAQLLVAKQINNWRKEQCSVLLISHAPAFLDLIQPDAVHLLAKGVIVKSGDKNLVKTIIKKGYLSFGRAHSTHA